MNIQNPVATLADFCESFTFKKFFTLLILLGLAGFAFIFFENSTHHFSTTKMMRDVEIIQKISEIRTNHDLSENESQTLNLVVDHLRKPYDSGEIRLALNFSMQGFVWGLSPWLLLGLLMLFSNETQKGTAVFGCIAISIPPGLLCGFLPESNFVTTAFIRPWGFMVAFIIVIITFSLNKGKKSKGNV